MHQLVMSILGTRRSSGGTKCQVGHSEGTGSQVQENRCSVWLHLVWLCALGPVDSVCAFMSMYDYVDVGGFGVCVCLCPCVYIHAGTPWNQEHVLTVQQ